MTNHEGGGAVSEAGEVERPGAKDNCGAATDWSGNDVEQLVHELSWELEEAALDPRDYVTVNREKLTAIAKRVLARAALASAEPVESAAEPDLPPAFMGAAGLRAAEAGEPACTFAIGDRVTKRSGSAWTGRVVGTYSTTLTPEGYAVESENEPGSVQIYPAKALTASQNGDA